MVSKKDRATWLSTADTDGDGQLGFHELLSLFTSGMCGGCTYALRCVAVCCGVLQAVEIPQIHI